MRVDAIEDRVRNADFRSDGDIVGICNDLFIMLIDIDPKELVPIVLLGNGSQTVSCFDGGEGNIFRKRGHGVRRLDFLRRGIWK